MDVVEFLSERIDEDEAAARKLLKDRSVSKSGRWYEERLLRECQAKRTLIAVVEEARQAALASLLGQDPNAAPWNPEAIEWTSRALNAIALPYAEHPDYQPDWRLL